MSMSTVSQSIADHIIASDAALADLRVKQHSLRAQVAAGKAGASAKTELKSLRDEIVTETANRAEYERSLADALAIEGLQATAAAKAAKIEAAKDCVLAKESTLPMYADVDAKAKALIESFAALKAASTKDVEPLFHKALTALYAGRPDAKFRFEDTSYLRIDSVRGNDWHMKFAVAKIVQSLFDILNADMSSFFTVNHYGPLKSASAGTFEAAGQDALAKVQVALGPLLDGEVPDNTDVTPAHVAAAGPEKGSQDPEWQRQQREASGS
jgi:hypothetical protein